MRDGVVVKGVQFRDHRVMGDILALASRYRDEGADEVVFYDITASPDGRTVDRSWVNRVARVLDVPFCVAGGIRTLTDAENVLKFGAEKISVNTPALEVSIRCVRTAIFAFIRIRGIRSVPARAAGALSNGSARYKSAAPGKSF